MPDEEPMTREEQKKLFEEWEQDYALRREENANRRLPPAANTPEARRTAEILPFPSPAPPHPWPSELAKGSRHKSATQQRDKTTEQDTGHSYVTGGKSCTMISDINMCYLRHSSS
jgi:hypothetical protein